MGNNYTPCIRHPTRSGWFCTLAHLSEKALAQWVFYQKLWLPAVNNTTVPLSESSIMSDSTVWLLGKGRAKLNTYHVTKIRQDTDKWPFSPPLGFVTGSERVPTLGLDKIKMTIKVKEVEDLCYDEYYPQTHTCFSTLELPLYSTKEIMHTKLTEALSKNRKIYSDCIWTKQRTSHCKRAFCEWLNEEPF